MEIGEALAYLDAHVNLEAMAAAPSAVRQPTLERITAIAAALGDPERDTPMIHVTGTNGKGSTVRIASQLLLAAGLTVGTYTSPHLQHVNERIRRNGLPIGGHDLAEVISAVALAEASTGVRPTYFEILTAAAYRHFSDEAVDVAVIEVGMAGRWDATNIGHGRVAVITNVGLDHTEYLGDDRRSIASEKVGIAKAGSTFVVGETDPGLADILGATPAEAVWWRGPHFGCDESTVAVGGRLVTLRTPARRYPDLFLPLHGAHQALNASAALAAVEAFLGYPLEPDVVGDALAEVRVAGRFEVMARDPLLVIDGAHNPDGARALVRTLDEEFTAADRRVLVVGMLARDADEMVAALDVGPERDRLVVCCAPDSPRAVASDVVAAAVRARGADAVVVDDVGQAIDRATGAARAGDIVVVTGSLYLVGAARTALGRHD